MFSFKLAVRQFSYIEYKNTSHRRKALLSEPHQISSDAVIQRVKRLVREWRKIFAIII